MTAATTNLTLRATIASGFVTFLLMLPETLPVPVLRGLVLERFAVDERMAGLFMSANMIGALLAAPWLGRLVQRAGSRRGLAVLALLLDALAMQALARVPGFTSFLLLRIGEGAVHIAALTLVMSLVADAAGTHRGRALGCLGAGLTLGVATGAAIGGQIGKHDPLRTLHIASVVLATVALLAARVLPSDVANARPAARRGLLDAWRQVPKARAPLLVAFVERFTVGFFTTGFPLLLPSGEPVERARIGMLLGAFLYPFAVLSWPMGRLAERWSHVGMVAVGCSVYGVGVMSVGVVSIEALWVVMPLLGISSAVLFVPSLLWLLERAPEIDRTTAMAAFHGAGSLGFLAGPICCGQLIALGGAEGGVGHALAFAVAGLTALAASVCVAIGARRG